MILGDQQSSVQSIFEAIKRDLIEEYGNIQDPTYRNSVQVCIGAIRDTKNIVLFPEIGIQLGPRMITPTPGAAFSAFSPLCDVFVRAVVSCNTDTGDASTALRDATSSIIHDMKRVTALCYRKHETVPGKRWNIEDGTVQIIDTVDTGDKPTRGYALFMFKVRALPLDSSFMAQP